MRRGIAPVLLCLLSLSISSDSAPAQAVSPPPMPRTLFDPKLEGLREASRAWAATLPSERVVLDQVCLVPDLPTFFEALSYWDESSYFPILIDDVPHTLRFLRAFKPARIVRFPKRAATIDGSNRWEAALTAAGRAMTSDDQGGKAEPEKKPLRQAPGVVISSPTSPSLAAAAALAAGRGQRLIRFDFPDKFGRILETQGMSDFASGIESAVAARTRKYGELGDEVDFITLAGDWPYRYNAKDGFRCIDDLVGRNPKTLARWAFTGRLLGDEVTTVYQAMCSLFLATESAALFNSYSETGAPWAEYQMKGAAAKLSALFPVVHSSGPKQGTLDGWHETFDPRNRHGLVLINSSGGTNQFSLIGRSGYTQDVPQTMPTAVAMIHSFSAADPTDDTTIAGRWLANGAFVYHGSVHEPYLMAFRTPDLTSNLIAEGLPLGAVFRQLEREPVGIPWKLIYIGDPLYRVTPRGQSARRTGEFGATENWPRFREGEIPKADAGSDARFAWALQAAMARTTREGSSRSLNELIDATVQVDRSRLDDGSRKLFDDLVAELLYLGGRYREVRTRASRIPKAERSPHLSRVAESAVVVDLHRLARNSFAQAVLVWEEVMRQDLGGTVKSYATSYLASAADSAQKRASLRSALIGMKPKVERTESEGIVRQTLEQLEKAMTADR